MRHRMRRGERMKIIATIITLLCSAIPAVARDLSDAQVKQAIIQESIAYYPGPCPCPYNVARNGSACGRRSAYSKQGGYDPICYAEQVTAEMIRAYRQQHGH